MDFLELAKARFSCRSFSDKEIPQELIDKIIEAGRVAPTARNTMPVSVYLIRGKEARAQAEKITPCAYGAPILLMICFDREKMSINESRGHDWYGEMDASIAATHMMMEAQDLGLYSCWVGRFDPAKASELYKLPENIVPAIMMPIGYAADGTEPADRHSIRRSTEEFLTEL